MAVNDGAILDLCNVTKTFDHVRVLDHVCFSMRPSDGVVAITGSNASGKTTLFNIVTGLLRPDADATTEVKVLGQSVTSLTPWQVARLGVGRLFQDARVFLGMTVMENLAVAAERDAAEAWWRLPMAARHDGDSRELLELVGLEGRERHGADSLSLGDRRKLAIACMLRTGAILLLLDEPTANLDASATAQMLSLLQDLASRGRHIVLVEHNREFVRDVANTVLTLQQGTLLRAQASPLPVSAQEGDRQ